MNKFSKIFQTIHLRPSTIKKIFFDRKKTKFQTGLIPLHYRHSFSKNVQPVVMALCGICSSAMAGIVEDGGTVLTVTTSGVISDEMVICFGAVFVFLIDFFDAFSSTLRGMCSLNSQTPLLL